MLGTPRENAIRQFTDLLNARCHNLNQLKQKYFDLRQFHVAPFTWLEGVLWDNLEEWQKCVDLVTDAMDENLEQQKQIIDNL